jgi:hypothetical protein
MVAAAVTPSLTHFVASTACYSLTFRFYLYVKWNSFGRGLPATDGHAFLQKGKDEEFRIRTLDVGVVLAVATPKCLDHISQSCPPGVVVYVSQRPTCAS